MVYDAAGVPAGPRSLDSVRVLFNEWRLLSDAGLLLTASLADRLGLEELVNESVWLRYRAPGGSLPGRKVLSLVHGMVAGADSIDDTWTCSVPDRPPRSWGTGDGAIDVGGVPAGVHVRACPPT